MHIGIPSQFLFPFLSPQYRFLRLWRLLETRRICHAIYQLPTTETPCYWYYGTEKISGRLCIGEYETKRPGVMNPIRCVGTVSFDLKFKAGVPNSEN